MGGSYGGYMVMAGLTEYPKTFAAGANLFGVVNFETFFKHTEPWMAAISKIEYGDPDKEADMLRELSPIHKVDRVAAPTIVLHGANDTNVPVVEAEQVVESLKKRGVPVEYVLFPDEGHGFRKTPNRIRSTVAIVQWFEQHLKREIAPHRVDRHRACMPSSGMLQLESANILLGARADSKEDAIRQVAGLLARCGFIEPGYAESMLARERVANTYLGKGVAIPHGLPKDRDLIERTGIAVLQVPAGVAWQTPARRTAHLIVGIAARVRRAPRRSSATSPACSTTTRWSSGWRSPAIRWSWSPR